MIQLLVHTRFAVLGDSLAVCKALYANEGVALLTYTLLASVHVTVTLGLCQSRNLLLS